MQEMITRFKINDSKGLIPSDQIRSWREAQVKPAAVFLRKATGRKDIAPYSCQEFAEIKGKISEQDMSKALKKAISKSHTNLLLNAARARRIITIQSDIKDIHSEQLIEKFKQLLYSDHANSIFLHASAAHYMLKAKDGTLDIIETFAPEELPAEYFLKFNDNKGLQSKEDDSYSIHYHAAASLPKGKHIGGLRIELKDIDANAHLKVTVECASYCTDEDLSQCRMHVASELQYYLLEVLSELG